MNRIYAIVSPFPSQTFSQSSPLLTCNAKTCFHIVLLISLSLFTFTAVARLYGLCCGASVDMWSLRMERTLEENEKCFMAGDWTKESYRSRGALELKKLTREGG